MDRSPFYYFHTPHHLSFSDYAEGPQMARLVELGNGRYVIFLVSISGLHLDKYPAIMTPIILLARVLSIGIAIVPLRKVLHDLIHGCYLDVTNYRLQLLL